MKFIPEKCVLCSESKPLTVEHIFPEGAGGRLTADILCKDCNSNLGTRIDAPYLEQSYVQLARNALQIQGKRNNIPQPFSEIYEVPVEDGKLRIRMDVNFRPRVIPQVSDVTVGKDGSLAVSLVVDAKDREKLPNIIRAKVERFFSTPAGKNLNWSPEQIERGIVMASEQASDAKAGQSPVGEIMGNFNIDLKKIFVEHIKVAYEVACIHYKYDFINTPRSEEIRQFLYENSQNDMMSTWDINTIAKRLRISPQIDHNISQIINQLTGNTSHEHHVALVSGKNIIVSMFGLGAMLIDAIDDPITSSALFLNNIKQKKCSIIAI